LTTEIHELPEIGELVIATITKIGDHGAYVTLDEYERIQGFLHVSEIAPGWVRNISKYVKENEKVVAIVKKVREGRGEIDLSLKHISKDQKKKKLLDVKRHEKGKSIIKNIQKKASLSDAEIEKIEDKIFSKYDSVYDAVIDIATNGIQVFNDLDMPEKTLAVIEAISSNLKLPSVEIRGILEITDFSPNGIENIKKILRSFEKKDQKAIDRILRLDAQGLYQTVRNDNISMCGVIPTVIMLVACKQLGAAYADLVKYMTSGEVTGDHSAVVGYGGIIVK
jgi:translation initiation factor 2 subunit 1